MLAVHLYRVKWNEIVKFYLYWSISWHELYDKHLFGLLQPIIYNLQLCFKFLILNWMMNLSVCCELTDSSCDWENWTDTLPESSWLMKVWSCIFLSLLDIKLVVFYFDIKSSQLTLYIAPHCTLSFTFYINISLGKSSVGLVIVGCIFYFKIDNF